MARRITIISVKELDGDEFKMTIASTRSIEGQLLKVWESAYVFLEIQLFKIVLTIYIISPKNHDFNAIFIDRNLDFSEINRLSNN